MYIYINNFICHYKSKRYKGILGKKSEIDPFINHSLSFYVPEEDELKDSEGERICRKFYEKL